MIRLHRLGPRREPIHLNPDLFLLVEAMPDTVVTLTTGTKFLVAESPEQVADAIRAWRASVLDAMTRAPRRTSGSLALVRGTAADGAVVSLNVDAAAHKREIAGKEHRP